MSAQPFAKYNPAFLTDEQLVAQFVVRQPDLALLVETMRENRSAAANQHLLIVAPRGFGKTTLVRRLAVELRQDPVLSVAYLPVIFGEESYEVLTAGQFWLEALLHVGDAAGDAKWREMHRSLLAEPDEQRLAHRALAALGDAADQLGRRLVLIVENLDMLLGEQVSNDGAWELRHALQNEPRLVLVATAVRRFAEATHSDRAMYDLFRVSELEPLDTDACRALWRALAGQDLEGDRIRPMQILTGGNPRLLGILATFAAGRSFQALMADLTRLIDDHTSYFKSNVDALPAVERKVFVTLADLWQPATSAEVAAAARVKETATSALLGRLVERGAVMVARVTGRTKHYQVAERLYNIYHLMRRRGGPEPRVAAVVEFMAHFYAGDGLAGGLASIAAEACRLPPEARGEHLAAFSALLRRAEPEERALALQKTPPAFFGLPDLPDDARVLLDTPEGLRARLQTAPDRALLFAPKGQGEGREAAARWAELVPSALDAALHVALYVQDFDAAEAAIARMGNPNSRAQSLRRLAAARFIFARGTPSAEAYERAERAADTALAERPTDWGVLTLRAMVRESRGDHEGEIADLRRVLEHRPHDAYLHLRLGQALLGAGDRDRGIEALQRGLALEDSAVDAAQRSTGWRVLARALRAAGRPGESLEAQMRSVELAPGDEEQAKEILRLCGETGQVEEVARWAERLLRARRDDVALLGLSAAINSILDKPKATRHAKRLLELAPKSALGFIVLSTLGCAEALLRAEGKARRALGADTGRHRLEWADFFAGTDMPATLERAVVLLGEIEAKHGVVWESAFLLAQAQSRLGRAEAAKDSLAAALRDPDADLADQWVTGALTDFCAALPPGEARAFLKGFPGRPGLDPFRAALDLMVGEFPKHPLEVVEVGKDVRKAIERAATALKARLGGAQGTSE